MRRWVQSQHPSLWLEAFGLFILTPSHPVAEGPWGCGPALLPATRRGAELSLCRHWAGGAIPEMAGSVLVFDPFEMNYGEEAVCYQRN